MTGWDGVWGVAGWLGMSLMMLVFWSFPIALVVLLIRSSSRFGQVESRTPPQPGADQVLAERYARGEIDEDEFTRRRDVLRTGPKGA